MGKYKKEPGAEKRYNEWRALNAMAFHHPKTFTASMFARSMGYSAASLHDGRKFSPAQIGAARLHKLTELGYCNAKLERGNNRHLNGQIKIYSMTELGISRLLDYDVDRHYGHPYWS